MSEENQNGEKLMFNMDDKDLAMISLTTIAIISMFVLAEPLTILTSVVSGILGLATGNHFNKSNTNSGK